MSNEANVASMKLDILAAHERKTEYLISRCESPIEAALLLAMMVAYEDGFMPWPDFVPDWWRRSDPNAYVDSGPLVDGHAVYGVSPAMERAKIDRYGAAVSGDQYGRVHYLFLQAHLTLDDRSARLDFALIGETFKLAIEADGHDFHERTKEQAARDRSRDRALQRRGWTVLRFTGSEIHKDPVACARAIAEQVTILNLKANIAEEIERRTREGIE